MIQKLKIAACWLFCGVVLVIASAAFVVLLIVSPEDRRKWLSSARNT